MVNPDYHKSQEQLFDEMCVIYKEFAPITQAADDTPEGKRADELRDAMDPLWYAMKEDARKRLETWMADYDAEHDIKHGGI